MTQINIIQWIVDEKLATNHFAAAHLANGLKLTEVMDDPEEQKRRVMEYRKWRRATKDTPEKCYQYVLEGREVPAELFEAVEA